MSTKGKTNHPDWDEIRATSLRQGDSLRSLSEQFGVPLRTLERRCSREGWAKAVAAAEVQVAVTVAAEMAVVAAREEGEGKGIYLGAASKKGGKNSMRCNCILQVEDDENDIFLLRRAFERAGIGSPVQVVRDGREAMDYLTGVGEFADRVKYPLPCMVMLDLNLPRINGLELLKWIRQQPNFKSLVVVLFSSSSLPEDVSRACALGANSYICKPTDVHRMMEIAQLLKGWWLGFNHFAPIDEGGAYFEVSNDVEI